MAINLLRVTLLAIVVHSLLSTVQTCKDKVIDEVYDRMNSYKGNQLFIPGAELCENSMILECKEYKLSKLDMVELTFSGVLPMKRRYFLDVIRSSRVKRGDPVDGDPNVPARTTRDSVGRPADYPQGNFVISGIVKFKRQDDSEVQTLRFSSERPTAEAELQITCLDASLDKLENIYVEMNSANWNTDISDCTGDDQECNDVESIVLKKVTNSFTVALKKLIERLGTTGKPNL